MNRCVIQLGQHLLQLQLIFPIIGQRIGKTKIHGYLFETEKLDTKCTKKKRLYCLLTRKKASILAE